MSYLDDVNEEKINVSSLRKGKTVGEIKKQNRQN
jgi:hypothetical protein